MRVENRVFQARWETDYLCLVCLETLSAMKYFNISRHYNTLREKYKAAADLKSKVHQQRLFTRATTTKESSLKASYAVALELAKAKKPLSDGEIVKRSAVEMAKAFGDDNLNFETVSLSRRTVSRRVTFTIMSRGS